MSLAKKIIEFVMDILETIVFIGSLFIVTYLFIVQPNQIRGASMEPTFYSGEYILTSKITYKFRPIQRGDVVVFQSPKNPDIDYIKRIIALPGDTIMLKEGEVYINDFITDEQYISAKSSLWDSGYMKEGLPIQIPKDEIFVMGDNRPRSSDSREFGPVHIDTIIGQVFFRYFPTSKIGFIPNPIPKSIRSLLPIFYRFHEAA